MENLRVKTREPACVSRRQMALTRCWPGAGDLAVRGMVGAWDAERTTDPQSLSRLPFAQSGHLTRRPREFIPRLGNAGAQQ